MKKEKNITTMNSRSITVIIMVLLFIQIIWITNSLWLGRADRKVSVERQDGGRIALSLGDKLDGAKPITKAELAEIYARDHMLRYMIFETKNGWQSDRKHWAGRQMDFLESVSDIKIKDPDSEATLDMAKVVMPGFKLEYTETIYRSLLWGYQFVKRVIILGVIYGIALIIFIKFSMKSQTLVVLNLLLLTLSCIYAVNNVAKIAFFAITIYVLLLSIRYKCLVVTKEALESTPLLLASMQIVMLFVITLASNIVEGILFSVLAIVAIWYYATRVWKPIWIPNK